MFATEWFLRHIIPWWSHQTTQWLAWIHMWNVEVWVSRSGIVWDSLIVEVWHGSWRISTLTLMWIFYVITCCHLPTIWSVRLTQLWLQGTPLPYSTPEFNQEIGGAIGSMRWSNEWPRIQTWTCCHGCSIVVTAWNNVFIVKNYFKKRVLHVSRLSSRFGNEWTACWAQFHRAA